jgi:hypothetical protein
VLKIIFNLLLIRGVTSSSEKELKKRHICKSATEKPKCIQKQNWVLPHGRGKSNLHWTVFSHL